MFGCLGCSVMGLGRHMEWWGTISFGLFQECKFWLITIPSGKVPFHHGYYKDMNECTCVPFKWFFCCWNILNELRIFNSLETSLVKVVVLCWRFSWNLLRIQQLLSCTDLTAEKATKYVYLFKWNYFVTCTNFDEMKF